jgi:hypothetical protein
MGFVEFGGTGGLGGTFEVVLVSELAEPLKNEGFAITPAGFPSFVFFLSSSGNVISSLLLGSFLHLFFCLNC